MIKFLVVQSSPFLLLLRHSCKQTHLEANSLTSSVVNSFIIYVEYPSRLLYWYGAPVQLLKVISTLFSSVLQGVPFLSVVQMFFFSSVWYRVFLLFLITSAVTACLGRSGFLCLAMVFLRDKMKGTFCINGTDRDQNKRFRKLLV